MISIDRTMKCVFLTRSKAVHDKRQTVTVVWLQRINQNGDVIGTGYFRIQEYKHHKGEGLRKRIRAWQQKRSENIEFQKSSGDWGTVTHIEPPERKFEIPK